jgi:hypothetical protein
MDNTTESNQPGSEARPGSDQQSELHRLLEKAKPESEDWQDSVGRLVSQHHLRTLQADATDKEFLQCVCLVVQSQAAGSKVAKKKTLNLGRFKDRPPSDFSSIQTADDQKSVLGILSKVRAAWCLQFISETLQASSTDRSVIPVLMKWAAKCSHAPSTFWTSTVSSLLASQVDEKSKLLSIKEWEKSAIGFIRHTDGNQSIKEFNQLLAVLAPELHHESVNKKLTSAIFTAITFYVSRLRERIPMSIIDGVFSSAVFEFNSKLTSEAQVAEWQELRRSLSESAASLLNSLIRTHGPSSTEFWSHHLPNLIRAYPKFEEQLAAYATENQLIDRLLGKSTEPKSSANSIYELEDRVSNLLLNWQNFRKQYPVFNETDSLDLLVKSVAKTIGVEYFGEIGSSCTYDPIEHSMIDQNNPASVITIMQPGIRLKRVDGTQKILHPAIVK